MLSVSETLLSLAAKASDYRVKQLIEHVRRNDLGVSRQEAQSQWSRAADGEHYMRSLAEYGKSEDEIADAIIGESNTRVGES